MQNKIKKIILRAGKILSHQFYQKKDILTKSTSSDLVTATDRQIESFLIDEFSALIPGSAFIAEETHPHICQADYLWIIDPIDGTTNFTHSYPFVCISVALYVKGACQYAFVYNPILNEFYTAACGGGAFLNNEPITCSSVPSLNQALLATGFPYNFALDQGDIMTVLSTLKAQAHGIRRSGSAALDICHTARGIIDGYYEWRIRPWDVAAGILIACEAGATVTSVNGQPYSFCAPGIVVANRQLHKALLKVIPADSK